jgi:hypothetical protein
VALNSNGSVTIETHKGSIKVTTWDRPEVEIQARIEAEPGSLMDQRRFEGTDVLVDSFANSVRIKTKYPDDNGCCFSIEGSNPVVRYTIQMPRAARLSVRDHRSDTQISDLQGELDINTHRGTVDVHKLGGPLRLSTHRGEVKVDFASFAGNTIIDTHRGSIELSIPKNSRFDIQTSSERHATFESDFSVISPSTARRGESFNGSVNGGGPILRIKTDRGHIRLRAR